MCCHINVCVSGWLEMSFLSVYSKVKGINSLVPTSFNHNVSQNSNKECLHFTATVIIILRYLMVKIFFLAATSAGTQREFDTYRPNSLWCLIFETSKSSLCNWKQVGLWNVIQIIAISWELLSLMNHWWLNIVTICSVFSNWRWNEWCRIQQCLWCLCVASGATETCALSRGACKTRQACRSLLDTSRRIAEVSIQKSLSFVLPSSILCIFNRSSTGLMMVWLWSHGGLMSVFSIHLLCPAMQV